VFLYLVFWFFIMKINALLGISWENFKDWRLLRTSESEFPLDDSDYFNDLGDSRSVVFLICNDNVEPCDGVYGRFGESIAFFDNSPLDVFSKLLGEYYVTSVGGYNFSRFGKNVPYNEVCGLGISNLCLSELPEDSSSLYLSDENFYFVCGPESKEYLDFWLFKNKLENRRNREKFCSLDHFLRFEGVRAIKMENPITLYELDDMADCLMEEENGFCNGLRSPEGEQMTKDKAAIKEVFDKYRAEHFS